MKDSIEQVVTDTASEVKGSVIDLVQKICTYFDMVPKLQADSDALNVLSIPADKLPNYKLAFDALSASSLTPADISSVKSDSDAMKSSSVDKSQLPAMKSTFDAFNAANITDLSHLSDMKLSFDALHANNMTDPSLFSGFKSKADALDTSGMDVSKLNDAKSALDQMSAAHFTSADLSKIFALYKSADAVGLHTPSDIDGVVHTLTDLNHKIDSLTHPLASATTAPVIPHLF